MAAVVMRGAACDVRMTGEREKEWSISFDEK
jgi:hypothetical protein